VSYDVFSSIVGMYDISKIQIPRGERLFATARTKLTGSSRS
jgi:hypothetical protein